MNSPLFFFSGVAIAFPTIFHFALSEQAVVPIEIEDVLKMSYGVSTLLTPLLEFLMDMVTVDFYYFSVT